MQRQIDYTPYALFATVAICVIAGCELWGVIRAETAIAQFKQAQDESVRSMQKAMKQFPGN